MLFLWTGRIMLHTVIHIVYILVPAYKYVYTYNKLNICIRMNSGDTIMIDLVYYLFESLIKI